MGMPARCFENERFHEQGVYIPSLSELYHQYLSDQQRVVTFLHNSLAENVKDSEKTVETTEKISERTMNKK